MIIFGHDIKYRFFGVSFNILLLSSIFWSVYKLPAGGFRGSGKYQSYDRGAGMIVKSRVPFPLLLTVFASIDMSKHK